MKNTGLFTVNAFAKFARTTRNILHHYDKIGLLHPTIRKQNGYRYYSGRQLAAVNVIHTLQRLGMSLSEIKEMKDLRTPEYTDEIFSNQIKKIDQKITEWNRAKKLLLTLQHAIRSAKDIDERVITVRRLPEEAVMLGKVNDYSRGRNDYDALTDFYGDMTARYPDLDLNYPVWAVFSEERIKNRDWTWPDRYYFYNPAGDDRRPAGLYVIGHQRGGYGQNGRLYQRLLEYIGQNGLEICGDAYEEYPLNEVCVSNDSGYLMRIMIRVREKE